MSPVFSLVSPMEAFMKNCPTSVLEHFVKQSSTLNHTAMTL